MEKDGKRTRGEYYTNGNPFKLEPFLDWSSQVDLPNQVILEPYAGANNIIKSLQDIGLCNEFRSFDICPRDATVERRNTIENFPSKYKICVTNPPWLARNSATRRGLSFPQTEYDDLYKHCLRLCLEYCSAVAALVPASFFNFLFFRERLSIFRERLQTYVLLHDNNLFVETDNPVCLALFGARSSKEVRVYYDNEYVGELTLLEKKIPVPVSQKDVRFNDVNGTLGFVSFDNTVEPSIRFCLADEIAKYPVKESARFFSRIHVANDDYSVEQLNSEVESFRNETRDLFLTPFKGIRKDGEYRRRMSFALAKDFINAM